MKKQMMPFPQLPLSLRCSVRMLCCQVFFIIISINSQAPFPHLDSVIFISEGSYLYSESQVDIYTENGLSQKLNSLRPKYKVKHKAFTSTNVSSVNKNHNKIDKSYFINPKSAHHIVHADNPLSVAVLGNFSQSKKHHKIVSSAVRAFRKILISQQSLQYLNVEHQNILKIITIHFSRPPPGFNHMIHFLTHKSHKK